MMTQNGANQWKMNQRWGSEHKSSTVMSTAAPFRIWDAIKQFHPYKKEILIVARTLNNIGANRNIIAATLCLQGWKTFYGCGEWTEEDVDRLL